MKDKGCIFFWLLVVILIGCKNIDKNVSTKEVNTQWLENEFKLLKTEKDKEKYLTNMFVTDQELRTSSKGSEILMNNNFNEKSPAYLEHINEINSVDSLNFIRVNKFLDVFGYPKTKYEDYRANYAINAVCLHQPYQNQVEILPLLYQAHLAEHLSGEDFLFFLNKMHIIKYQTSFTSDKVYDNETDQVHDLIKKLDLVKHIEKLNSSEL